MPRTILRLRDCQLVGVIANGPDLGELSARLTSIGMPYFVQFGLCLIASDVPIKLLARTRRLTMMLGTPDKIAAEVTRGRCLTLKAFSRVADQGAVIEVNRCSARCRLFRSWTGSSPLYYAIVPGARIFGTRIGILLRFGVVARGVRLIPPGDLCVLSLSHAGVRRRKLQNLQSVRVSRDEHRLIARIRDLVARAVGRFSADAAAVLLSGGVDSTVLAFLLASRVKSLEAFVMSVRPGRGERFDSTSDLYMARRVARWLGVPLHEILVSLSDAARVVPAVVALAETRRASIVDEMAGMYYVAKHLRARGFSSVFTGEGPDDIFGGLEFTLRFTPFHRLHRRMRLSFAGDLPLELAAQQKVFSGAGGVALIHPYLYRPLVRLGLSIAPDKLVDRERKMKTLFRRAFAGEVPEDFLWRDKAITRVATGLKTVQEARFGRRPTRYYQLYRAWLDRTMDR